MHFLNGFLFFGLFAAFALPTYAQSNPETKRFTDKTSEENILVLDARYGPPTIPVTIGDQTYTFLVDPSDRGISLTVNASVAKEQESKDYNRLGWRSNIEGTETKRKTGAEDIKLGDFYRNKQQLIHWFEKDYYPPYDGRVGAGVFWKADKVVFLLSDVTAPQKQYSANLKKSNHWIVEHSFGESKKLKAWSSFRLHYDLTHTNLLLSQRLKDTSLIVPEKTFFDLNKEFSTKVKLANGQLFKSIPLLRGDVTELKMHVPENSLIVPENDTVVVKARSKKRKAKERPQIYLGRDYFIGCTSLEFRPKEKRVDLYCDDNGNEN